MKALLIVAVMLSAGVGEAQYENLYTVPTYTTPTYTTSTYTTPTYATPTYTEMSSYSYGNPATVVSPSGDYLGTTSANKFDPDSINNPYGTYGSKYSPDSVNNPYGRFGSKYSVESANNPYAHDTPQLYGANGTNRGKLSANTYDAESIENPYSLNYDKPLATNRQIMRTQIISDYTADPNTFISAYSKLSTDRRRFLLVS